MPLPTRAETLPVAFSNPSTTTIATWPTEIGVVVATKVKFSLGVTGSGLTIMSMLSVKLLYLHSFDLIDQNYLID